ncbi:MAG: hypothetical protein JRD89_01610 [Deltaproteobacteria bacterium]|nr:hypothetical protein [Deltaproteobacteria bacterium]
MKPEEKHLDPATLRWVADNVPGEPSWIALRGFATGLRDLAAEIATARKTDLETAEDLQKGFLPCPLTVLGVLPDCPLPEGFKVVGIVHDEGFKVVGIVHDEVLLEGLKPLTKKARRELKENLFGGPGNMLAAAPEGANVPSPTVKRPLIQGEIKDYAPPEDFKVGGGPEPEPTETPCDECGEAVPIKYYLCRTCGQEQ